MLPRPYACKYARALMCIYCMYVKALFTASWKASKTWNDKHSTDFCLDHLAIPSPTMDSTYIDRPMLVKAFWSPALKNCHGGKEKPRASACPNIETARTCEHLKWCSWAVLVQATPTASKRRQQELPKHWKFLQDEIIAVYLITQMTLVTSPGVTTEIGRERLWWNWSCHQVQPTQSKRPFTTYLCESSRHGIWCQSYVFIPNTSKQADFCNVWPHFALWISLSSFAWWPPWGKASVPWDFCENEMKTVFCMYFAHVNA